jgi:uncharacterized RDD family membrane protein YckC
MTLPPDEGDPVLPGPASEPASGEAPTQAWAPAPPAAEAPPAASPIISADPATGAAPAVAWASPTAQPRVVAPGLTWADTASRFVAYVLDSILITFVSGILLTLLGFRQGTGTTADNQATALLAVLSAALGAAYFILSWSGGRRATPGQRLFNIQVGNAFDGRALTTTQAVKRWLGLGSFLGIFALVPGAAVYGAVNLVQFIWAIVLLISTTTSPTKQGLHDRFANSAVVRPVGASTGLAAACLVLVIALLVLALVSIVALIFLGGQVSAILSAVGESV